MKNELFTIGPFTVYSYGFMIAVGVFAAWLTAEYRAKKYRADTDQIFFLVLWCLVGGLLGAGFCSGSQNGKRLQEIQVLF